MLIRLRHVTAWYSPHRNHGDGIRRKAFGRLQLQEATEMLPVMIDDSIDIDSENSPTTVHRHARYLRSRYTAIAKYMRTCTRIDADPSIAKFRQNLTSLIHPLASP